MRFDFVGLLGHYGNRAVFDFPNHQNLEEGPRKTRVDTVFDSANQRVLYPSEMAKRRLTPLRIDTIS